MEEQQQIVANQKYCYGCLCKIDENPCIKYSFRCNAFIEILQTKQVPLCPNCTEKAFQSECFIQDIQKNQTVLNNSLNKSDSIIQETQDNINQQEDWAIIKLNPEYFPVITKTEVCDDEVVVANQEKVKIELEPIKNEDDQSFDYQCNIGNEIKTSIKVEPQVEYELPCTSTQSQKTPKKKESEEEKEKEERSQETTQEKIKIQLIRITMEQLLKEREDAAKEEKYINSKWKCVDCVKGFMFKCSYEQHMERHSEKDGDFECDICKQRYQTEEKAINHRNKFHFMRYKCPKCDLVRVLRNTIRDHYTTHHADEKNKFRCLLCTKAYSCYMYLKRHIKTTHTERVRCEYCDKLLAGKSTLKFHIMRLHTKELPIKEKPKPYTCPECSASFCSPSLLKRHSYSHTDTKQFYCVECDKSFQTEAGLKLHLKTVQPHVNYLDLPFPCTQCDKKFSNTSNLVRHTNLHHLNIKPFKCDKCDKSYTSNASLQNHYKLIHEGYKMPKKYPCPTCDRKFHTNAILKNHIRTHTGERPFQCTKCSATFSHNSVLGTHMKLVHLKLRRDGRPKASKV